MPAWQYSKLGSTLESSITLNPSAPLPPTGKDKVLVRVHAASLNPADYKFPEIPLVGSLMVRKPATPGMDFAGVVVSSAAGFTAGDRVFGKVSPPEQRGSLARFVAADPRALARLPANVDFVGGAALGTAALTAYQTVVPQLPGRDGKGRTVVVNGATGGVGCFTVQIAKAAGARVVATCSGTHAEMARGLGADEVIDYRSVDVVKELKGKGKTVDLVVDNVGETAGLHKGCDAFVKDGGKLVQVGGGLGLTTLLTVLSGLLQPAWLGGARTKYQFLAVQANKPDDWQQIAEWAEQGKLKPVIDSVFAFDQAREAFEKLRLGRAKGKIVVKVEDD